MNITLERIAALIPKDDGGEFKHGAIKDFAVSIGYKSGNIVSMWFNGDSDSYKKKLHEIAAVYNVSVEWLKGETDIKEKSPTSEDVELSETQQMAWELIKNMDEAQLKAFIAGAKSMLGV